MIWIKTEIWHYEGISKYSYKQKEYGEIETDMMRKIMERFGAMTKISKAMPNRTIVVLDIDGVLAPLFTYPHDGDAVIRSKWATWIIPAKVISFLQALDEKTEIVWGSNWKAQSNDVSQSLLGKHFEHIDFTDKDGEITEWFKYESFAKFAEQHKHRNIIIVDDEMTDNSKHKLSRLGVHCYITDGATGLTDTDIEAILKLVEVLEVP